MKEIDRGSIKSLIISTLGIIIAGIILYPIFDFLWAKIITHSTFAYSISQHVIAPIGIGTFMGVSFWLIDKFGKKDKK